MPRRLLLLLLLSLLARPASAQVVRGTLTAPGGGPEPGATVLLVDSAGFSRGQALSNPTGFYGFVAPFSGHFRIRVIRVGFPDWQTDPFELRDGATIDVNAELPGVHAKIPALTPTKGCAMHPQADDAAGALLAEVQKALEGTDGFLRLSDYRFDVHEYSKVFDDGHVQLAVDTADQQQTAFWPVKSLPVDRLAADGFIQGDDPTTGPVYYGPDAEVFFSDFFLNDHCFQVVAGKKDTKGLVGLHFKPATSRPVADLDGVLWVDPVSSGLVRLEFGYTHMPDWAPKGSAGGVLDFARLPSGFWSISKWRMWAPIPERFQGTNWWHFIGYAEVGGQITRVTMRDGTVVFRADTTSRK